MELKEYQKSLLEKGNRYTFAEIFCETYPDVARDNNFKPSTYNAWLDFNEDDKIYTVWNKNGDKDFFDTNMEFLGRKEY
jgi:hypothetical protein